jgi:hypothetical protein
MGVAHARPTFLEKVSMLKNVYPWLPDYARQAPRRRAPFARPTHVFFCFVDHFEPLWQKASHHQALERVEHWHENYPRLADRFRDADGRTPQHTFFYPAEAYRVEFLDLLSRLCARGYGEVEIHLHHDNDTADNLKKSLEHFKAKLRSHGCLSQDSAGTVRYGFIHGDWALDNSRRDGRWCGVNDELHVLRDTGCFADFTLPSAPSDTQTRKINAMYYATDDPQRPKSHDTGNDVRVGGHTNGDLLILQGPLALNWRHRTWGLLPRIERAEIAWYSHATPDRIDLWVRQRVGVVGKPDWIFVKVHTHGCQERNFAASCGESAVQMHEYLQQKYNRGGNFRLHYVTAREMFNLVKAAEAGKGGNPNSFRDYLLLPPPIRAA